MVEARLPAVLPTQGAPTAVDAQLGAGVGKAAGGGQHRADRAAAELHHRGGAVFGPDVVPVGAAAPGHPLGVSHPPQHQVQEVHRLIGQRAALGVEPAAPALRHAGVVVGLRPVPLHAQVGEQQAADGAGVEGALDAVVARLVALLEVHRQQQPARLRFVNRRIARRGGDVHRLGHAHVLAGAERLQRHPGVGAARRPQTDHVHVGARQQLVVTVEPRHAPGALRLPAARGRQVAHRHQVGSGGLSADLRASLAHAQSYDCKPYRCRHVSSARMVAGTPPRVRGADRRRW